mgnify:CR=1 FL=1
MKKTFSKLFRLKHSFSSFVLLALGLFVFPPAVYAASAGHSDHYVLLFGLATILVAAKVFHIIERVKQPPVLGELTAGIVLGNLVLFGFNGMIPVFSNETIKFLAELGVIVLLFQIGLESNVKELTKVGVTSLLVALVGGLLPFAIGAFLVSPLLIPDAALPTHLFIGASLAATSVGITARVFKDADQMQSKFAKIVIGAAVLDDILGLILLSMVATMAEYGAITLEQFAEVTLESIGFLVISIFVGQLIAPWLSKFFSVLNTGAGTKLTLSLAFCLVYAGIAQAFGLEAILGAFAAGLVLDPVHFAKFQAPHVVKDIRSVLSTASTTMKQKIDQVLDHHIAKSVDDLIEPVAYFLVPIFFVVTGSQVELSSLFTVQTVLLASVLTVVAVATKFSAGIFAPKGMRSIVGLAMVPRGEVGLIFASIGRGLGVLDASQFSVIVLTVLLTTLIGPTLLSIRLAQKQLSA